MYFKGKLKSGGYKIRLLLIFKLYIYPDLFGLKFSSIVKKRFEFMVNMNKSFDLL